MNDKIPIWLKKVNQKIPIKNPIIEIIKLELFKESEAGRKFISEYCDGIKFATKLVDTDAITTKIEIKFVINKLSKVPAISVGLVNILDKELGPSFKNASTPVTINSAKKEKIIKFKIKLIWNAIY